MSIMSVLIDFGEDFLILAYEHVRTVTHLFRWWVFVHFPMLALSSIGKMVIAVIR